MDCMRMGYTQPVGCELLRLWRSVRLGIRHKMLPCMLPWSLALTTETEPPCTQAIIDTAGISDVHIALLDPNPVVSGTGGKKAEMRRASRPI